MSDSDHPGPLRYPLRISAALGSIAVAVVFGAAFLPAPTEPVALHNDIEIACPPDEVFNFVTTPGNWPKWHPASLAVSGATDHPLAVGEEVTEDYLIAGRRGQAVWKVVDRDAPWLWRIAGMGNEGGRAWITYSLVPVGQGTLFRRELRYRMPNLLAATIDPFLTRNKIAEESSVAVRQLKAQIERREIRENRRS